MARKAAPRGRTKRGTIRKGWHLSSCSGQLKPAKKRSRSTKKRPSSSGRQLGFL